MPLRDGASFAGFAIVRLLGSGEMGDIYAVQHPRLPRLQALRILPATLSADPEFRTRFHRESNLAAALTHPHILGIHDVGEHHGQLWTLTSYIDGNNAAQLLRDRYPRGLPHTDVLHIVSAIADALDYAHEYGLLHRNIKPANILLSAPTGADRRILLADFGIPHRITDITTMTAANLTYTAPEQLHNMPFQGRADQYSLAATTYHLLTGTAPFAATTPIAVINRHLAAAPPRLANTSPHLAQLDTALSCALAKDPTARFNRCQDFAAALSASAPARPALTPTPRPPAAPIPPPPARPGSLPGPYPPPGPPPPPGSWPPPASQPPRDRGRRRWTLGAVAALVAVAAVVAGLALTTAHTSNPPVNAPTTSSASPAAVASANDTGPVAIITDEPTCRAWKPIGQTWLLTTPIEQWDKTHPGQPTPLLIAGTAWTRDQRAAMKASSKSTRLAASKTTTLTKTTPHRVIRELYEQFIAYGRAFADSIDNDYRAPSSTLGAATEDIFNALTSICDTVDSRAATAREPLANPTDAPPHPAPPQDLAHLQRYLTNTDLSACGELISIAKKYNNNPTVKDWGASDHTLPPSGWNPHQQALNDAVAPLMLNLADDIQRTIHHDNNPVMQDIGALTALYQRVFAKALPTYTFTDDELNGVALYARQTLEDTCQSIGT